ncbi:hypothetical protein EXU57_21285 [Segetibacter sp. 3557_3]|uniref:L,D-transpeptidase family protein n=1 Tax=Segetibacter sp. 3557_3 TaxID=2547429 RepID=UPI0010584E04|nr:L,D-transpeptidase family protein [Segetibacter sp. 3557_3]TDH20653.1 hypothetical protein EXU57_21285 [Segetibacter sp. 3557_3]
MKHLTAFTIFLCTLLVACKSTPDRTATTTSNTSPDEMPYNQEFLVERDTTIDSSIAYNDLFLDTSAVSKYIQRQKLPEADAQALRGFYNMRNFQYAWFAGNGLTEQGNGFWNAYTYAKSHGQKDSIRDKALVAQMDKLADVDTLVITPGDSSFLETEIALTHRFIRYYNNTTEESLLHQLPLTQLLPARKTDPVAMADSVLKFSAQQPASDSTGQPFFALKRQLATYDSLAKAGGWQPIHVLSGMLSKGQSSPVVSQIKKRLHATGELPGTDTTTKYNDSLLTAVKAYQEQNGFNPDGFVTDSLIMSMNVPVQQRISQILVNLNRMAWMPPQVKQNFVAVNIPDFMLEVHDGDSIPLKMEVVVGKAGSNTMMFTGDLNQVVFSPTWNLPASIVREEVLPQMQKNPGYLKQKNMEVVRRNDSLPEIRQLPGPGNALGRVKFLFPNSYDIYLHDTEARHLFTQNKRAFSHGCIRLADAESMSGYVLRNDQNWTPEKIRAAMNANKEQFVAVKSPIPVVITYFTTWVDNNGRIHFRDDIYEHDKRTGNMMFTTAA